MTWGMSEERRRREERVGSTFLANSFSGGMMKLLLIY